MFLILLSSVLSMVLKSPTYSAWNGELGITENKSYPDWVMAIALAMIVASVLPMPLVFLLRRFQILKVDLDIHQGSIRRNETTASTKEMIDEDDDDDDDDFSGPALGGPVNVRSDSDDEDEPPTMGKMLSNKSSPLTAAGVAASHQTFQFKNQHHLTPNPLAASPTRKKPFSMEVMDF